MRQDGLRVLLAVLAAVWALGALMRLSVIGVVSRARKAAQQRASVSPAPPAEGTPVHIVTGVRAGQKLPRLLQTLPPQGTTSLPLASRT